MKIEKTNAVRLLEQQTAAYTLYNYESDGSLAGVDVAHQLGQDVNRVFKTLVTTGKSGSHYVFMIPVAEELDLKKAAAAAGEKAVEMLKAKDLLPLTGYVHGGCSPIGMKKVFPTFIDETAILFDTILFSGGKIGLQIETSLENLQQLVAVQLADLIKID